MERAAAVSRGWRPPLWLVLAAALAVLTLVPYAYAHLVQPPGRTFMGFFFLADDANTYLAKMRQGWEGSWVWTNRYTTESSPPVYFFIYWLALGHLAAFLHLPLLATFHLARVAGAFLLLWAGWTFIGRFVTTEPARRFAIWFMGVGLGFGVVIWAIGSPYFLGQKTEALDLRMPELTAFYSILALPHFAWAAAFQALAAVLTLRAAERGSFGLGAVAGLCWLGEASIHPQMPILIGAALGVALLYRRVSLRGYLAVALAMAMVTPYIAYAYFAFLGNPEVTRWSAQWRNNFAPDVLSLGLALLPQLALAALWLPRMLRRRSRDDVFLLGWLLLLAVILWLPNPAGNLRRRFFDGVYMPLVVMAANGMYEVLLPHLRSVRPRRLLAFTWVVVAALMAPYLDIAPIVASDNPAYSARTADYHALLWMADRPAGAVLSTPEIGLLVPAYTPDTVYVGQYSETYNAASKAKEVAALYAGDGDIAAFTAQQHIRYVIWSPAETSLEPPASLGAAAFSENGTFVFQLY
jgi:hypothetical protein